MGIDELITLEDGKEYILMLKTMYNNEKYFLAAEAVNKEPSNDYLFFKEIIEEGSISVEEVYDADIIKAISEDFDKQINEMEDE